jgi:flagellar protein FliS
MTKESAVNHYAQVGVETGLMDASPHSLILMLLEGAIISTNIAKMQLENHNIPEKCAAISKALAIIDEGLRASLDKKAGEEIAENLDSLYEYMGNRLVMANLHNQTEPLDEVVRLLTEIKEAWEQIKPKSDVPASAPQPSASVEQPPKREPQSYGKA